VIYVQNVLACDPHRILWLPLWHKLQQMNVLPAGTLVQCTLDEPNFSSRTGQIGDPVLCHLGAVAVFGHSLFPRGAYLAGRFRDYRDPGHFFGKGWIELVFEPFWSYPVQ